MTNTFKKILIVAMMLVLAAGIFSKPVATYAAGTTEITAAGANENDVMSSKAMAAAIAIASAAGLGAIAMGIVIAKSVDGIARQPEAEGKIRTSMMLGLVFVETAIIYALIVAILIIFVL